MRRMTTVLLVSVSLLTGCATDPRFTPGTQYLATNGGVVTLPEAPFIDTASYWNGAAFSGAPSVIIRLSQQRAYFYKGEQLVGVSQISTGREGSTTPSGNFRIIQKDKDHASSCFGDYVDEQSGVAIKKDVDRDVDLLPRGAKFVGARMPYFMRIVDGVGMHQGFLPGYPASHGCIQMPKAMAEAFFHNVSLGTPVRIIKS